MAVNTTANVGAKDSIAVPRPEGGAPAERPPPERKPHPSEAGAGVGITTSANYLQRMSPLVPSHPRSHVAVEQRRDIEEMLTRWREMGHAICACGRGPIVPSLACRYCGAQH